MSTKEKKSAPEASESIFENFSAKGPGSMKEGLTALSAAATGAQALGKGNFEAVVQAGTIYTKGMEALVIEQARFTKQMAQDTLVQMRQTAEAKTPQGFMEQQLAFFRSTLQANMIQCTRLSQMWVKTARQSVEPLGQRYKAMAGKTQSYNR